MGKKFKGKKISRAQLMQQYKRDEFRREHPERSGLIQMIRSGEKPTKSLTDDDMGLILDDLFATPPAPTNKLYMNVHTQAIIKELMDKAIQREREEQAMIWMEKRMAGQRRRQSRQKNRRNN